MNHKLKNKYDVGIFVGRLQVPMLTEAHFTILDMISENHPNMVVILGTTINKTKKNPLGYIEREQMIKQYYPNSLISYVADNQSDEEWSKKLDEVLEGMIYPTRSFCIYGGRDSFINHYHGKFDTFEIEHIADISGSKVREQVSKSPVDSIEFRKGEIYAINNQFNKTFPTVDIAIINDKKVLMGQRNPNSLFRFFGGFVDTSDNSLEEACIREAHEEVDIEFDTNIEYVCSKYMPDYRYRRPNECILTTLFKTNYVFGTGKPKEEFYQTEWVELSWDSIYKIYKNHRELFIDLLKNLKIKKPKDFIHYLTDEN